MLRGIVIAMTVLWAVACTDATVASSADAVAIDGTVDAAPTCPRGAGCSCSVDGDCASTSACIPTPAGRRCAAPCVAGACPDDYACTALFTTDSSGNPHELKNLCVHRWPSACDPCVGSSSCTGTVAAAACVASGAPGSEAFCAPACAADVDCPVGSVCKDTTALDGAAGKRCWPKTGICACSPAAIVALKETTCRNPMAAGTPADSPVAAGCIGHRHCEAIGLTECIGMQPQAEICNGEDDDCNGKVDDGGPGGTDTLATPCADKDPCTDDKCAGTKGCVHVANTAPCDDGDTCTTGDGCLDGACKPGKALACDDGNPCTDDACDVASGCTVTDNTLPCNDKDPCTGSDACAKGACHGTQLTCDDANPCTIDTCAPGKGCDHAFAAGKCDDGNACTVADSCNLASCVGDVLSCDDGYACTLDTCDPVQGCKSAAVADSACGTTQLPLKQAFSCNDADLGQWQFGDPPQKPKPEELAFRVVGAAKLSQDPSACALQAGDGVGLQCTGVGPALATSPLLNVKPVAGAPLILRFESGGSWPIAGVAQVRVRGAGDADWKLAATVPQGGSGWSPVKIMVDAAPPLRVRFAFTAPCGPGFQGWFIRNVLVMQDVCAVGQGGCDPHAACAMDAAGLAACTCQAGWQGNGKLCQDVDECVAGTAGCDMNGACINLPGSALCACKSGWTGDGKTCLDVDECTVSTAGCSVNAACANSPGGFACTCKAGWTGNGKACSDVDECATGTAGCNANAMCANTAGSFTCTCKGGWAGDGKACADVDECAAGKANCAAQATCANTAGSFACTCKAGWVGTGVACAQLGGPEAPATSCLALLQANPATANGVYWIDADGAGPLAKQQLTCDMAGGGWTRVGLDDFQAGVAGWSGATVTSCGGFGAILGGYNVVSVGPVTKTFAGLPVHTALRLKLDFLRIDSWDGESGIVKMDGTVVFTKAGLYTSGTNQCGAAVPSWLEEKWPIDVTKAHSQASVLIAASTTLDQAANDESFGIDNVEVWVK